MTNSNGTPCPSDSWDAYEASQEGPEGLCVNCLCDIPEEDPDPGNGGDSPWREGYCSEDCRERIPVPSDEDKLKELDAYGHLTWTVGYNDEWSDDNICPCPTTWEPGQPKRGPAYGADGTCTKCGGREGRGDWMACFDFVAWEHPSRGVLIAYEVTVNSDSGGFIDTLDRGVATADKAPTDLPDYWASIGMDDCTPWTEDERKESWKANDRWNAALGEAIGLPQP